MEIESTTILDILIEEKERKKRTVAQSGALERGLDFGFINGLTYAIEEIRKQVDVEVLKVEE